METTMNPPQARPRAGPKALRSRAGVAAGAWTEIVGIIAPAEAAPGDTVNIELRVKNLADYGFYIGVAGQYDTIAISFSPGWAGVDPGATYPFIASFTMPNYAVHALVESFYWTGTEWSLDDYKYFDIALAAASPGTITRKDLEHDGTYSTIPVYNLPQTERGLVHIWGRNNSTGAQQMGISWTVNNPQGTVVEQYAVWEAWPYTGGGKEHEFIGGRFNLDMQGAWSIEVYLFMNPSSPTIVDSYSGILCTVTAGLPESQFSGFAVREYNKV
jgi:hypothetical protein